MKMDMVVSENNIKMEYIKKYFRIIVKKMSTTGREYDNRTRSMRYFIDNTYYRIVEKLGIEYIIMHVGGAKFVITELAKFDIRVNIIIKRRSIAKIPRFSMAKGIKLRKEQHFFFNSAVRLVLTGGKCIIQAPAGVGKTVITIFLLSKLGGKAMLFISSKFVEQWIASFTNLSKLTEDDIMIIQGKITFQNVLDNVDMFNKKKIFILSNDTFNAYLKDEYGMKGDKILNALNIQNVVSDETHIKLHQTSQMLLFMNPKRFIGLSATYFSDQVELNRIQEFIIPHTKRISNNVNSKYVNLITYNYNVPNTYRIKTETVYGFNTKIHMGSMLRIKSLKKALFDLNFDIFEEYYLGNYRKGDKVAIFFPVIVGVLGFEKYIKKRIIGTKYKRLKISIYKSGVKFDDIKSSDVIITTDGKASVGTDIKGLTVVISNVNVSNTNFNNQFVGRLRYIDSRELYFIQLYNSKITKHVGYLQNLKNANTTRVKNIQDRSCEIRPVNGVYELKYKKDINND